MHTCICVDTVCCRRGFEEAGSSPAGDKTICFCPADDIFSFSHSLFLSFYLSLSLQFNNTTRVSDKTPHIFRFWIFILMEQRHGSNTHIHYHAGGVSSPPAYNIIMKTTNAQIFHFACTLKFFTHQNSTKTTASHQTRSQARRKRKIKNISFFIETRASILAKYCCDRLVDLLFDKICCVCLSVLWKKYVHVRLFVYLPALQYNCVCMCVRVAYATNNTRGLLE